MLNSVVTLASQFSLEGTTSAPKQQMHRPISTYSATSASDTGFVSDEEATLARSETTRGLLRNEGFWGSERSRDSSVGLLRSTTRILQCQAAVMMTLGSQESLVNLYKRYPS